MSDTTNSTLVNAPEFIEPATILQLTEEQQTELIESIRQRRLVAVTQYLQVQEEKKKVLATAYEVKYDRVAKKIARYIEKIDEEFAKLEAEFGKLKALRFEALDIL